MSINISAYDTTAAAAYQMRATADAIERAGVVSQDVMKVASGKHDVPFDLVVMRGGNSFTDGVPFFRHPLLVKSGQGGHDGQAQIFAVDVRQFGKWSPASNEFVVRNGPEYGWAMRRAVLNQIWMDGRVEILRDISNLPAQTYQALLSECISRRFALDPAEQMAVAALAAYFYFCQFTDEDAFTDVEKNLLVGKIAKITNVPVEMVSRLVDESPVIHNLEEFCIGVRKAVQNVALENFNIGTLLAVVAGTWIGTDSREIVSVGLEHIPTWLSIVASSLESAIYKRSTLSKIAQRYAKGSSDLNFLRSLEAMMGGPGAILDGSTGKVDMAYERFFHA